MSLTPETYEKLGAFFLGRRPELSDVPLLYDSRDLLTHAVCVGMTGSGKTGLCIGLLEEALIDGIPSIVIDPKGDIGNLLLSFPELRGEDFRPWVDPAEAERHGMSVDEFAASEAKRWREGLARWGQTPDRIRRMRDAGELSIYTPGSSAGRGVSILGSLAAPAPETVDDTEAFAERVSGTATSLLALLGIDADPLQSSEHVYLSNVLTHFWRQGQDLDLATLIGSIQSPPFDRIGVMDVDTVFDARDRRELAMKTNNLLAAPSFAPWLEGDELDVGAFLRTPDGSPRVSIFSIAHLDDAERMFFVSLLLGRILDWTREQPGTSSLRALLYIDEVLGYLPPVKKPPSKTPLLTMLKQARAFGVGVMLATQNPVDLDYKALSNAGTWFLGRLQTEQDVDRVVDGLLSSDGASELDRSGVMSTLAGLSPRQFLLHNVHTPRPQVFETRWVLSYLRGPLTRDDIRRLTEEAEDANEVGDDQPEAPVERADPAPEGGERPGSYLPIHVPGRDDEELFWRPMAYGAGVVEAVDGRSRVDERVQFGFIRGLRGEAAQIDWSQSTAVVLDATSFRDAGEAGRHGELSPAAARDDTWEGWREALVAHVEETVRAYAYRCPKLKLKSDPGEDRASFTARVEQRVREERDEALDKLRSRYERKLERLESSLDRAKERLAREEDQVRDAKLKAAVNVGEALWSVFGGRSRSLSTNRATRVVKESRDVDRAQEKVDDVVSDIYDLQTEMEAALIDEAEKHQMEDYPIDTIEVAPDAIEVEFCGLVWVPYWIAPDGARRRAH